MPASLTLLRDQDGGWAHPCRPGDCSTHDHRDVSARCAGVQLRDTPPQHGTAGPAAPWTPPGVKPGSRTPHRYGPSQPPRLPLQPLHPLAGELAWRTAIRAGCGGPLGPTGRATSSASMVCTTCRPSRLPGRGDLRGRRRQLLDREVTCSAGRSWWACFGTAVSSWSSFLAMPHTNHTGGIGRDHLNLYRNQDTPPQACYWRGAVRWAGAGPGPSRCSVAVRGRPRPCRCRCPAPGP